METRNWVSASLAAPDVVNLLTISCGDFAFSQDDIVNMGEELALEGVWFLDKVPGIVFIVRVADLPNIFNHFMVVK